MILIDTSVWVALLNPKDSCHNKAKSEAKQVQSKDIRIFEHIFTETLTVLRNRKSDIACMKFINFLGEINQKIRLCNQKIFSLANIFFFKYKKLSFADSLLLATTIENNAKLITFDKELKKAFANESKTLTSVHESKNTDKKRRKTVG